MGYRHFTLIEAKLWIFLGILMAILVNYLTFFNMCPLWFVTQMVRVGMYGYALILLGNLYYLMFSDDFSTYPQHNIRINNHLRIDAGLSLLQAVVFLALPDFVVGFLVSSDTYIHKTIYYNEQLKVVL